MSPETTTGPVLLSGATVFDGLRFLDGPVPVLVDGPTLRLPGTDALPAGTEIRDVTGHTLTPGLIDTHVHLTSDSGNALSWFAEPFALPFYRSVHNLRRTLHAGVTTVRDAGGTDLAARVALERGLVEGPRLRIAVGVLTQTGGHSDCWMPSGLTHPLMAEHPGRPSGVADGVDAVRGTARRMLRAGADHIKICTTGGVLSPGDDPSHSQFTDDEIRVAVEEAAARGTYVMAHAQGTPGVKAAVRCGVRSIEHGIYLDDEAVRMMLDHGTYLVPTLQAPLEVLRAGERGVVLDPVVVEKARRVVDAHRRSVALAHAAGVPIAMGTDAGVGPHGTNLEELGLLTDVGLDTAEALRAATATAAELMRLDDVGRIADGTAADLVLFDGDLRRTGLSGLADRVTEVWQAGRRVR